MKLRDYRKSQALRYKDLAELFGVSIQTICKWECGSRVPRPKQIKAIETWSNGEVRLSDFVE